MWFIYGLFGIVVGAIGGVIVASAMAASKYQQQPPLPPPEPKTFGLVELERVKNVLGGLSFADAKVVKVATAVAEMEFTALDEIADAKDSLLISTDNLNYEIEQAKAQIASAQVSVEKNNARNTELLALANAFAGTD